MPDWHYVCSQCNHREPPDTRLWKCPQDAAPFKLVYESQPVLGDLSSEKQDLSRYLDVLPLSGTTVESLGAGMTPFVQGHLAERQVLFKLDSLLPTGSFKDRGAAVLVALQKSFGTTHIVVDSSGNAAAATAAFCAVSGIDCDVYAPAEASPGKLVQAHAYGAKVHLVEGGRDAVAAAAQLAADSNRSSYYASHNWSPVFAEGVKTWALETYEQLDRQLPHTVFIPTGGGSAFTGAYLGFQTAGAGLPRLVAAQPAACAPVVEAFLAGSAEVHAVKPEPTLAEGARIASPPRGKQLLSIIDESDGWAASVSEKSLVEALRDLWRQGIYVEPTAALGAAACIDAIRTDKVTASETLVVYLTGSGLKATETIADILTSTANG